VIGFEVLDVVDVWSSGIIFELKRAVNGKVSARIDRKGSVGEGIAFVFLEERSNSRSGDGGGFDLEDSVRCDFKLIAVNFLDVKVLTVSGTGEF